MADEPPLKTQTFVLTKVKEGEYRFAGEGDMSLEECVYGLQQLLALITGVARPTETFRLVQRAEPEIPAGARGTVQAQT